MSFRRELGPFDATMVVIGGIIGVGIFSNPSSVAARLDSPTLVLLAWAAVARWRLRARLRMPSSAI
jgi:APA family basic amino acid/polyamine antiporter